MKRSIISLVLVMCMVLSMVPVTATAADMVASGTCGAEATWSLNSSGLLTIQGDGSIPDYGSPDSVPWHSYKTEINAVVINNGITSIGQYAFWNCPNLTEIEMANSVTRIGSHAFESCTALENIYLSDSITKIFSYAFAYCTSLTQIIIPAGVQEIDYCTFAGCTNLESITLPASTYSIRTKAFLSCDNLADVFYCGSFEQWNDIGFESGVMGSGHQNDALFHATLHTNVCGSNLSWTLDDGQLTINGAGEMFCFSYYYGSPWYKYRSSITSIQIATDVTTIGSYAFYSCTQLEEITIPDHVINIGHSAFRQCNKLKSVSLPKELILLGDYAFSDCSELENLSLPMQLSQIGHATFYGCTSFSQLELPDSITQIGEWAFGYCSGLTDIEIPSGINCISNYLFYNCLNLKSVVLPDSITSIGVAAFGDCKNLEQVSIPDSMVIIGNEAFYRCYNLKNIILSANVETIGDSAFSKCNRLSEIYFYNDSVNIGIDAIPARATVFCYVGSNAEVYAQQNALNYCASSKNSDSLGHIYTSVVTSPTCTEPGYTTHTCANCGDSCVDTYVDALGHSYEAVVTEPSCAEAGYTTYTCACGESYVADEVDPLGHNEVTVPAVKPTCTETGLTEGTKCSVCGEILVAQEEISALGHTEGEAVIENETPATCTEDGSYDSVVYCSVCKEELSRETITVEALGHTEEIIPAVAADCEDTGLTEGKKCSVCGEILVAQEVVDALGHDWKGTSCQCCDAIRENPFTDVPEGAFYIDPVLWAVENGIANGATGTTFDPNGQCLRASVVTFLWRAAGCPEPTISENPFIDVKMTDFFYDAVLWAVSEGITNGTSGTTFSPYAECNRAAVVTFLWRYLGQPEPTTTAHPFTDVAKDQFYFTPMLWAVENGITNGLTATTFGPTAVCNRAQVVTFLYRAFSKN